MRFRFIKAKQAVKFGLFFLLSVFFLVGINVKAQAEAKKAKQDNNKEAQQIQDGKDIFDEVNCLMCHLLNGEGGGLNDAPDLAGVATRKDKPALRKWLNKHLFEEPRIDMFEEDPTDEDIEDLVQFLSTLKTPPPASAAKKANPKASASQKAPAKKTAK